MDNLREVIEAQISSKENVDDKPSLLYQVPMNGHIGVWNVKGIADLIAIWPVKDGKVKVRIFELKVFLEGTDCSPNTSSHLCFAAFQRIRRSILKNRD